MKYTIVYQPKNIRTREKESIVVFADTEKTWMAVEDNKVYEMRRFSEREPIYLGAKSLLVFTSILPTVPKM